jgi:hypothetical protein
MTTSNSSSLSHFAQTTLLPSDYSPRQSPLTTFCSRLQCQREQAANASVAVRDLFFARMASKLNPMAHPIPTTNNLAKHMSMPRLSSEAYKTMHLPTRHQSPDWSTRHIASGVSAPTAICGPFSDRVAMPDLQYSATHNENMIKLRDHVLPARCKPNLLLLRQA